MKANRFVGGVACALLCAGAAFAQDSYPSKPVRMLVGYPPGSGTDVLARLLGQKMSAGLGQGVVIDNRAGAAGILASEVLARSPADGYALAMVSIGHTFLAGYHSKLPYDTLKDFAGVSPLASLPSVLVVAPSLGVKNVQELVAMAKASPGKLNYATAGTGSAAHISAEKFRVAAGIDAVHVPLKGSPESITETMTGRTQFTWTPLSSAAGQIREGRLLALAVSTPQRVAAFPNVPTIAEAGVPGYEYNAWNGVFAPKGTPRAIVRALHTAFQKALAGDDVKKQYADQGLTPQGSDSPEQFAAFMRTDYERIARLVKVAGIKPE